MENVPSTDPYGIGLAILVVGVGVAAYLFRGKIKAFLDRMKD